MGHENRFSQLCVDELIPLSFLFLATEKLSKQDDLLLGKYYNQFDPM